MPLNPLGGELGIEQAHLGLAGFAPECTVQVPPDTIVASVVLETTLVADRVEKQSITTGDLGVLLHQTSEVQEGECGRGRVAMDTREHADAQRLGTANWAYEKILG